MLCRFACLSLILLQIASGRTFGGYNGEFIASGLGLKKILPADAPLAAVSAWSIYGWVQIDDQTPGNTLIAGIGDSTSQRYFAIRDGHLAFWAAADGSLPSAEVLEPHKWHFVAVTSDSPNTTLYLDGKPVAQKALLIGPATAVLEMAPEKLPWTDGVHFAGKIANFTLATGVLSANEIRTLYANAPAFDLIEFERGSKDWPVQTRQQAGYRAPQDPDTLPKSAVQPSRPVTHPLSYTGPALAPRGANEWTIAGGWRLAFAPNVTATGAEISRAGFPNTNWWDATVPGTVLTTLIDRGVYLDPYYGLNNLAIPETLNKQNYWYRVEFTPPASIAGRHLTLTFEGINYAAAVWLNGKPVGNIKGAFIRGMFDVTGQLAPGKPNALAVRISPPPHPGIPQEQSIKGGPGENGGILCLDGPTFIDTEGWDWIPGIRDRNTGIWQPVTLRATNSVKIGDVSIATKLPLPDTSRASVTITVPLRNESRAPVSGMLHTTFEGADLNRRLTVSPGDSEVKLTTEVVNPRLWWPNGYGSPELYHLTVAFTGAKSDSDSKTLRFGIREITYELSLIDATGHLRRVDYSPADAPGEDVVDVRHQGIVETPGGWVYSLRAPGANSPAIRNEPDMGAAPYLAVKVNGVRIACKGGNWGMDDALKRVSREHLEPFFRLHRDANLNIIRNWTGQSTEEAFYDLADEYGLLVWNDFWQSTQNYNVEPTDTALFLANARDTIARFRNHPSILLWCGRNEGVPAPALNEGLDELVRSVDGTRFYAPSSNVVNLQNSGPYRFQNPADYFTRFARGFAVELGVPSMPTLDSFRSFVPQPEQWPPSDTWAYHDWHQSGNGAVAPFLEAMEREFGPAADLEDFERKAQMLDYVEHRAIFEGFNAHLWNPNSGRMLWMTQPAWPSTMWQILSWDYDTQASFYGVKKACERVHVQLNLPDLTVAVVNNTTTALENLTLRAQIFSPQGNLLATREETLTAAANATTPSVQLPESSPGVVFIELELSDRNGALLSQNLYWYARDDAAYRDLNALPQTALSAQASETRAGEMVRVEVQLANAAQSFALMTKLTLRNPDGTRVLPAYYSDNYLSLAPGEKRQITIECSARAITGPLQIGLTGWNIKPATIHPTP